METRADTLALIQASFAGRDQLIERAFGENPSFRGLCEDYQDCAAALDRWDRLGGADARSQRREYAELLEGLGQEIRSWLEAMVVR